MSQPDRQSVSLDFKLSKNYNSVGGSVGFSSDRKEGETDEELYNRVYSICERRFDELVDQARKLLG